MTDAIVTERLTKHYGGRRVVDSLDLRSAARERVRAFGPQWGGEIDGDQNADGHGAAR